MTAATTPIVASTPALPLTAEQVRQCLKDGRSVLWVHRLHGREDVEEGSVVGIWGDQIHLCWLEGHKSRNDSIGFSDVLAIADETGPRHTVGGFAGKGFITEAGVAWAAQEKTREGAES